jgi:hypothetical protein
MQDIKAHVNDLFREAEYEKLFRTLHILLNAKTVALQNLDNLKRQFITVRRDFINNGIISYEEQTRMVNRISIGLQETIQSLDENDISAHHLNISLAVESEKMLVITKTDIAAKELDSYFKHLGLTNFDCKVLSQKESADDYLFILFDASEIKSPNEARREDSRYLGILSGYLAEGHLVVYYGKTWDRLDDYRNQVHAANSRFSLYHRVIEMKEVINKFNIKPSSPESVNS